MRLNFILFCFQILQYFILSIPIIDSKTFKNNSSANGFIEYLKTNFEKTFHQRCDKYEFIQQFIYKLEYSNNRFLTYVYQEPNLRNGGLGDKIGGLLSAITLSLRFNRTLLIRSHNYLHELFRPYHPTDIHNKIPKYSWNNIKSWTNYNSKYENHDETEYDLYDCIDTTGSKNGHCSMENDDVIQPLILYRSNRAYLCYYTKHKNCKAYYQLKKRLKIHPENSDLYEVGGCMLRLALWPTERLWLEIGKTYEDYFKKQFNSIDLITEFMNRINNEKLNMNNSNNNSNNNTNSNRNNNNRIESNLFQLGLHFRCGDLSYILSNRNKDMCVYDPTTNRDTNFMETGNPHDIGLCGKTIINDLRNFNHSIISTITKHSLDNNDNNNSSSIISQSINATTIFTETTSRIIVTNKTLLLSFITSDNIYASYQMKTKLRIDSTTTTTHSIIAPNGCHMEFDHSFECHLFTITQWFILSLSNILITQTLSNHAATSSFSRYAGIYGLNYNVFHDGRNCNYTYDYIQLSRQQQSNWFC